MKRKIIKEVYAFMRIANIQWIEATNYEGVGTTIFFQGCNLCPKCDECHNYEIWDMTGGELFTKEKQDEFIEHCKKPFIKRIVYCGGEPTAQPHDELLEFTIRLKEEVDKPIVIFTGYLFEDLIQEPTMEAIMYLCDVCIDGRFIKSLYSPKYRFFGSSNQRIIDTKASLETNKIVLVDIETEIE